MRRYLRSLAAAAVLAVAAGFTTGAWANSFAVSIGAPGFAVGYSNHGGYVAAYAPPPVYYGPAYYGPAYVPAPPVYYRPPVVYGGVVYYGGYRPYYRHYRHW